MTMLLCFDAKAKTLIVHVDVVDNTYLVKSTNIIDRPLKQTSIRPTTAGALMYQLIDRHNDVIAEGVISDPTTLAAEFHGEQQNEMEGELLKGRTSSFVIRVPYDSAMVSLNLFKYQPGTDVGMVRTSGMGGAVSKHGRSTSLETTPVGVFVLDIEEY